MHTTLIAAIIPVCLFVAVLLGWWLRRCLPQHHLGTETKDTIKLAMGLVATMTALLLGLLVNSAKASSDAARSEVIAMAAKVTLLDRVLTLYGPEAAPARARFREATELAIRQMWTISSEPLLNALHQPAN